PMVVIAGICSISTGKMFLGGIIPGILIGLSQMIISYIFAKKENVEPEPGHFQLSEVWRTFKGSWPALLMPVIIIGTITAGIVSPTEAGAIAVVYGLICGGLVYRELKWADLKFCFTETVRVSARIFLVIACAKLYTIMLTTAGFDKWLTGAMLGISTNPKVILMMILLLFFIVTMFMESIAALTLFMPIIFPIAMSAGIDPIVLGVLVTVMIGVGLVTPPVGMCIYVACDIMKITVGSTLNICSGIFSAPLLSLAF
ncbi:MAG: TRAP transporter large permease subunit, partial [Oscillospiraceae bacterium]|nr:TRAP transporter large permease subunit [Oscillospiraceae bacterium]